MPALTEHNKKQCLYAFNEGCAFEYVSFHWYTGLVQINSNENLESIPTFDFLVFFLLDGNTRSYGPDCNLYDYKKGYSG